MTDLSILQLKSDAMESIPASPASFSGASSSWGTMAHSTSSLLSTKSSGTATESGIADAGHLALPDADDLQVDKIARNEQQADIDWKFLDPAEPVASVVIGPLEAVNNPSLASLLTSSSVGLSQLCQQVPSQKGNHAFLSAFEAALQSVVKDEDASDIQLQAHAMALVAAHVATQQAAQVATQQSQMTDAMSLTTLGPMEDAVDFSKAQVETVEPLPTPKFPSRRSLWDSEERSATPTAFFADVVEEVPLRDDSDDEKFTSTNRRHTVTIMETQDKHMTVPRPRQRGHSFGLLPVGDEYGSDSSEASNYSAMSPAPRSESHEVADVSWDEKEEEYDDDEPRRKAQAMRKKRNSLPLSPLGRGGGDYEECSKKQVDLTNRPFKCLYCDSSFVRKHDLKRHERIHLGIKPYSCTMCGKSFSRLDAMNRHCVVRGCKSAIETPDEAPLRRKKTKPDSDGDE